MRGWNGAIGRPTSCPAREAEPLRSVFDWDFLWSGRALDRNRRRRRRFRVRNPIVGLKQGTPLEIALKLVPFRSALFVVEEPNEENSFIDCRVNEMTGQTDHATVHADWRVDP